MIDYIKRFSSSAAMRRVLPNAVPFGFLDDTGRMGFKDSAGVAQSFVPEGGVPTVNVLADSGAIPIVSGIYKITKATAAALTLAAPTAAQEGTTLRIHNQTAAAHVITATNLLDDGVTGGAKDTATFGAFAGASIVLVAINLKWSVESKNVVTIAAV